MNVNWARLTERELCTCTLHKWLIHGFVLITYLFHALRFLLKRLGTKANSVSESPLGNPYLNCHVTLVVLTYYGCEGDLTTPVHLSSTLSCPLHHHGSVNRSIKLTSRTSRPKWSDVFTSIFLRVHITFLAFSDHSNILESMA